MATKRLSDSYGQSKAVTRLSSVLFVESMLALALVINPVDKAMFDRMLQIILNNLI